MSSQPETDALEPIIQCPGCGNFARPGIQPFCTRCGICLTGPQAAELLYIAAALAGGHRWLMERRAALLAELWRQRDALAGPASSAPPAPAPTWSAQPTGVQAPPAAAPAPVEPPSAARPFLAHQPSPAGPPRADAGPARRREMSPRMVANLLLAIGGLLVVVAAIAFTAANWSSIGDAGRAAILLALAAAALAAPWPLARRGLTATAEVVAGIGLALTVADTYLARHLATGSAGVSPGLVAVASAILAVVWALYGSVAPPKCPRLAAIAAAQLPVPFAVAALASARGTLELALVALALLATTVGDLILADWARRRQLRPERQIARIGAACSWLGAIGLASASAATAPALRTSSLLGAVFVLAAVIGLCSPANEIPEPAEPAGLVPLAVSSDGSSGPVPSAVQSSSPASGAARGHPAVTELIWAAAGLLIAVGLALPVLAEVSAQWAVGALAVSGAIVAAAAWSWLRLTRDVAERLAGQVACLAGGGLAVLGGAGLWAAPAVLGGLLAPLAELGRIWASAAAGWTGRLPEVSGLGSSGTLIAAAVIMLVSLACWQWPASNRLKPSRQQSTQPDPSQHGHGQLVPGQPEPGQPGQGRPEPSQPAPSRSGWRAACVALAAAAVGAVPAGCHLPVWAGLTILTAVVAALLGAGSRLADQLLAGTASVTGVALAVCAAATSLAAPVPTVVELAALVLAAATAAWMTQSMLPAVLTTATAVAAAVGLACAVPLAVDSGQLRHAELVAAFSVLAVAVAAVAVATALHRVRPLHALALDLAAVPAVIVAATLAGQRGGVLSVLATAVALVGAGIAWLRADRRRDIALWVVATAAAAAIAFQLGVLLHAAALPYREIARPWHRLPAGQIAGHVVGLPLALVVLAACAGAIVIAAGAWRGGRGSLTALAVTVPLIAAPASAAFGLNYGAAAGTLAVVTLAMTGWAAASRSRVPAGAALVMAWPTLSWALGGPDATVCALGGLAAGACLCAWRARLAGVKVGAAAAAVATTAALAWSLAAAAGLAAWIAGLAVLAAAGGAQLTSAALAGRPHLDADRTETGTRAPVGLAVEIVGWLAALVGVLPALAVAVHASIALAAAGALCLGVALRPARRTLVWVGLALGQAALSTWLAAAGVRAPEAYTGPAALIVIAFGWQRSAKLPARPSSWLTYGPGLALLLLPSLAASWNDRGWLRPLLLGLVTVGLTLAGGRARLQAPLLLGGAVAVVDAGRQLAPDIARLAGLVPRWVPIALLGLVLLVVGATYEARLRDLGRLRTALGRLH
jgi:hypothetical protein